MKNSNNYKHLWEPCVFDARAAGSIFIIDLVVCPIDQSKAINRWRLLILKLNGGHQHWIQHGQPRIKLFMLWFYIYRTVVFWHLFDMSSTSQSLIFSQNHLQLAIEKTTIRWLCIGFWFCWALRWSHMFLLYIYKRNILLSRRKQHIAHLNLENTHDLWPDSQSTHMRWRWYVRMMKSERR